ncbi:hypothetical protein [Microlunatus antarcticus]|uniref:Uncharacterized protein n=1 Tax=Microlunatus antarcticus TaxID=53388 RepID=A0A7W5JXD8_9ACTN|nr:hypothetical protein [Microlunatus antarcticus]MBB3328096.1 hypothetical protein [Microlunatus antarcticus]
MSTTTLLMIVGGVVCLKTLAFVGLLVRRGRRQRVALAAAAEAVTAAEALARPPARGEGEDPAGWRLLWAEPGVMLVENAGDTGGARDVELRATLTSRSGVVASAAHTVRFVASGACFTVRFAAVDPWLAACTLDYALVWRTPAGERRRETRNVPSVVPVPDLALEAA